MRFIFSLLILLFHLPSLADDFIVFEKDGYFGLKDKNGIVAVPAVYEQLGWSNGNTEVVDGIVGFKRDRRWGILSTNNKVLETNKFYTLVPFDKGILKASVKGKFSNQLFYGLITTNGEIKVSFNYFSLEKSGPFVKVSTYDPIQIPLGLISYANTLIAPIEYGTIESINNWHLAKRFNKIGDLYLNGELIAQGLDSIRQAKGIIAYRKGYAAYFDERGNIQHDFEYKNISLDYGVIAPTSFHKWEVFDSDELLFTSLCDSIKYENNKWFVYVNNNRVQTSTSQENQIKEGYQLVETILDQRVLRNKQNGMISVWRGSTQIIEEHESIEVGINYYLAQLQEEWDLYNAFGTKKNRSSFEYISSSHNDSFIAKRNGYWGVMDLQGDSYISFRYDSIQPGSTGLFAVQFLNQWGIMNRFGQWKVQPTFNEIKSYEKLMVARKGASYSYYLDGVFLFKSTYSIEGTIDEFFITQDESGYKGLLNQNGSTIAYPEFYTIRRSDNFLILEAPYGVLLTDLKGQRIVNYDDGYSELKGFSEGLIAAKRNGRWGYLDSTNRLRISNRYDDTKSFKEGMAPIKLRGKWGFIDKAENLAIQPYYEDVSLFKNGLAVVKSDNQFGLVDKAGKEVVSVSWKEIKRSSMGNYLIIDENDQIGLADKNGSFILRPQFSNIQDFEHWIIVEKDGKKGVLDYSGLQKFKIEYLDIRNEDGFLLLKSF